MMRNSHGRFIKGHDQSNTGKTWFIKGTHLKEEHHLWKGDKATKNTIHIWMANNFGRPKKCEICGTKEKRVYDWANIGHEYKRDRSDWIRVCRPCHRKMDKDMGFNIGGKSHK
jgi:hypothetical protein